MIIFVVSTNRIKYFYLQKRNKGKKSVSVNNRKYKINTKLTIKCKQNFEMNYVDNSNANIRKYVRKFMHTRQVM